MTFPTVAATASTQATASTNGNINLPASISAGDLLLMFVSAGSTIATQTTPSGWNLLAASVTSGSRLNAYWKIASGSEGSTVALTTSASVARHAIAYRITGHGHTVSAGPEQANDTNGGSASTSKNPPSLSPSWGALDTLWIAIGSTANSAVTGTPTNYGNAFNSGATAAVRGSDRNLNASSDDPSAYTTASQFGTGMTVAVQPAANASPQFQAYIVN